MDERQKTKFEPIQRDKFKLEEDLSNLIDMSYSDLMMTLGGRDPDLKKRILLKLKRDVYRAALTSGGGVDNQLNFPEPLLQTGGECQTFAIVNGLRALGMKEYIEKVSNGKNVYAFINDVRSAVYRKGLSGYYGTIGNNMAHYNIRNIASELKERGLPLRWLSYPSSIPNPLKLTQILFNNEEPIKGKKFLGVSNTDAYHAVSYVPLQDPFENVFVAKLDSLRDGATKIGVDDYLKLLLSINPYADNVDIFWLDEEEK